VKGISEKLRCISDWYNIRTIFKTGQTLKSILVRTRPERDLQSTAHCIFSIPCECGRNYICETGRLQATWIREHRHNLKESLLEKSRLAQHANEEDHCVGWSKVKSLQIKSNSRYRKYKEAAHMACLTEPINQPSLEVSPIWIPLTG
jgi:hypothetical protein